MLESRSLLATNWSFSATETSLSETDLAVDSGVVPVIDSVEVFELAGSGYCAKLRFNYKNTTPSFLEYDFGAGAGLTGTTISFTVADDYLDEVLASDDTGSNSYLALNFVGSLGSSQTCGNYDAGSGVAVYPNS